MKVYSFYQPVLAHICLFAKIYNFCDPGRITMESPCLVVSSSVNQLVENFENVQKLFLWMWLCPDHYFAYLFYPQIHKVLWKKSLTSVSKRWKLALNLLIWSVVLLSGLPIQSYHISYSKCHLYFGYCYTRITDGSSDACKVNVIV